MKKALAVVLLVGSATGCAAANDDDGVALRTRGARVGLASEDEYDGYYPPPSPEEPPPPSLPEDYYPPPADPAPGEPTLPPDYYPPPEEPPAEPPAQNYQLCHLDYEETIIGQCMGVISDIYYGAGVMFCAVIDALDYTVPVEYDGSVWGQPYCRQKIRCDTIQPLPAGQGALTGENCVPVSFPNIP